MGVIRYEQMPIPKNKTVELMIFIMQQSQFGFAVFFILKVINQQ